MDQEPTYKRQNLITRQRLEKGDMEITRDQAGYINRASVRDDSILGYLISKHHLDYDHLAAAATYTLWQNAFSKPFYAEPRKVYLIEIAGGQSSGSNDEASYRILLTKLHRLDQRYVDMAIMQDVRLGSDGIDRQVNYAANSLRTSFDCLIRAIRQTVQYMEDVAEGKIEAKLYEKPLARKQELE